MMALVAVIAPLGWGHTYVMVLPLVILHLVALTDARPRIAAVICAVRGGIHDPGGPSPADRCGAGWFRISSTRAI